MDSKIRIKMGGIEIEYEGNEKFLKDEFPKLLENVKKLYDNTNFPEETKPPAVSKEKHTIQLSTSTIAAKMNCKKGGTLTLAAAARLTLALHKGSFTRQELLNEMKGATSYYKQTYNNNLTMILKRLVTSGKLLETNKDTYSLNAPQKQTIKEMLNG